MRVNGESVFLEEPVSLLQWLKSNGYGKGHIAVERNGEIIPKARYEEVRLADADCLEIVHFVGGG